MAVEAPGIHTTVRKHSVRAPTSLTDDQATLLHKNYDRVNRSARTMLLKLTCGNVHLVDEVMGGAWLLAVYKIGSLRDPERFDAWFYQIAHRHYVNCVRRGKLKISLREEHDVSQENATLNAVYRNEDIKFADQFIDSLMEIDATALRLFYLQGLNLKQMAATLGIPVGTVKRRLHTARNRARERAKEMMGKDRVFAARA